MGSLRPGRKTAQIVRNLMKGRPVRMTSPARQSPGALCSPQPEPTHTQAGKRRWKRRTFDDSRIGSKNSRSQRPAAMPATNPPPAPRIAMTTSQRGLTLHF